ncbi:putative Golgi pH regulator C [Zancudomyces culisetae]|uniref:Putative Golgi pH regulator C n=1 Tax=Zancudomyces culisetae TaxID=1213189 RepID=A0A1R1PK85_ZANCU|nr:putative Golgi pH regulator C [Zancudomyces culisetae]|eukprot:OMH81376.1 putative Golgi pH regulator C [Zancudomyces culisetae]
MDLVGDITLSAAKAASNNSEKEGGYGSIVGWGDWCDYNGRASRIWSGKQSVFCHCGIWKGHKQRANQICAASAGGNEGHHQQTARDNSHAGAEMEVSTNLLNRFFSNTIGYYSHYYQSGFTLDNKKRELRNLESFYEQLDYDLQCLVFERIKFEASITTVGKLKNVLGYFFSVYCVYKLYSCTANIVFHNTVSATKTDPITSTFLYLASNYDLSSTNVRFWSQQFSFITVFVMVFCSIRGLLIQTYKVIHFFTRYISINNIILFVSQIIGMYSLANMLMIRSNIPVRHRSLISDAIGSAFEFNFFFRWFDVIFVFSAIFSLLILFFFHQFQRDKFDSINCSLQSSIDYNFSTTPDLLNSHDSVQIYQ